MQHLLRMRALALLILGGLTAALVLGQWIAEPRPLVLPLVVAYFLFNFGYGVMVGRPGHLTIGTRLGAGSVLLNVAAMLVSDFSTVWTGLSIAAIIVALAAAFMLFEEARSMVA